MIEKKQKELVCQNFCSFYLKKVCVCVCVCVCIMQIQFLLKRKGIIYILSSFYISIKLISPPSPLPFESNSVGLWRVMSLLIKNGHLCIDIVISTILPWLLLHKMKTKAEKDVTKSCRSGRQEEWGEENGREKYILSITMVLFPLLLSMPDSTENNAPAGCPFFWYSTLFSLTSIAPCFVTSSVQRGR